jgi:hypothetical protein
MSTPSPEESSLVDELFDSIVDDIAAGRRRALQGMVDKRTEVVRPDLRKRPRRSKATIDGIKQAILDVIGEDPPMTVRQVFYQLVARGVIEKTEEAYKNAVIYHMAHMRLRGELRYDWVSDETRRRRITATHDSVEEALKDCAKFYRRSALREADDYIEIWCEKDALAGILWDVTSDYDVPLMVSRGMPSLTFLHGTALQINAAYNQRKNTYIYQFGDWDPSGAITIPQTIEHRLHQMCGEFSCEPPIFERVALTAEHIAEHDLPTRPTKRKANMHAKEFEGDSVELDALPPRVLRDMVREVIERHISPQALETLRAAEESERHVIRELIDHAAIS